MEVTRRPQALRTTPILLAVTPLPRPLTTPPLMRTYFIWFWGKWEKLVDQVFGFIPEREGRLRRLWLWSGMGLRDESGEADGSFRNGILKKPKGKKKKPSQLKSRLHLFHLGLIAAYLPQLSNLLLCA